MFSSTKMSSILFFAFSLFLKGTLGEVICESLPTKLCSYAIASSGKRCVLENFMNEQTGSLEYTCKTSEVMVERLAGYIESDECVSSCGVDRQVVGISSDAFMAADFSARLCSTACYNNCPNIADLYFNLAAGEGVFLPALCEKQKAHPHRSMLELISSSGVVASGPESSSGNLADAPALAPALAPESSVEAPTLAPVAF